MITHTTGEDPASPVRGQLPAEILTFGLAGETFAMNVIRVQEILDLAPVTRVPNAGSFSPGIINVRGNIVPLVNLRHCFGLSPAPPGQTSRTIVFEIAIQGETTRVAVAVDTVYNVETLQELTVEEIPEIGTRWNRAFVHGIARIRDRLTVVLDLDAVFEMELNMAEPKQIGTPRSEH